MKTYEELLADAEAIIERGDKDKIAKLFKDNYNYREKMRSQKELYEDTIAELKGKVPSDSSTVVDKEEYDALVAFKQQVGDFEQIQTRLQAIERLEQENKSLKNRAALNKAAVSLGYNVDALAPLIKNGEIVFEEDVPHIKIGDKKEPLETYVDNNLKVFLPAIKSGTRYPKQKVGGDNTDNSIESVVNNFISRHKPTTNKEKD